MSETWTSGDVEGWLYDYVFSESKPAAFSRCNEVTRKERFRQHYLRVLRSKVRKALPILCGILPPDLSWIAAQVRLPSFAEARADMARLQSAYESQIAGLEGEPILHELLLLETANFLSAREATRSLSELAIETDSLAEPIAEGLDFWHGEGLHYVRLRSSLKEVLPTGRKGKLLMSWVARTPFERHCVIYQGPGRRVHRKLFDPKELGKLSVKIMLHSRSPEAGA